MNDLSIIYYTDNSLDKDFEIQCQKELIKAANGKRIITVSQKPMVFGDNICMEGLGSSHLSLLKQALAGVKEAKTKYVAMAEHDCLYTPEHFEWKPTDDNIFWYNTNHWFVQKKTGEYSHLSRRRPLSQLICTKELFIPVIEEKIEMLKLGFEIRKGQPGACEPGCCENTKAFTTEDKSLLPKLKDICKEKGWGFKDFQTTLPNLDIRHGQNFSGGRRTKETTNVLPYWGEFKNIIK